jgi:magnesium and cobalt transporter
MHDPSSSRPSTQARHKTVLERLSSFIFREPENRAELLGALQDAHERNLLDADALSMMEGVLQVSELRALDLMVPRSQMDVIDLSEPPKSWIPRVIETAHSRFPVIEGNRDHVLGVLLAKELLRYYHDENFDVRALVRPALFVPETKPLNVLLREFRGNRNHMAIVIDEYGGVAGLITIEDVLEQIVGDIDDEFDRDERADHIVAEPDGRYRVKALTEIAEFNTAFATRLSDAGANTIGGLITEHLGRVPKRGDAIELEDLRFEILRADARRALLLQVTRLHRPAAEEFAATDSDVRHQAAA